MSNSHQKTNIVFFIGGSQSGKSLFAENSANKWNEVVYFATAKIDEKSSEWEYRLQKHRSRRPKNWKVFEPPQQIEDVVLFCRENHSKILLIDSLTSWLAEKFQISFQNYTYPQLVQHIENEFNHFLKNILSLTNSVVFLISNEVGEGVVPASESGRLFREFLGKINLDIAEKAEIVSYSLVGRNLLLKPNELSEDQNFAQVKQINDNFIFQYFTNGNMDEHRK